MSAAKYVYIFSGQKFIKDVKNAPFSEFFKKREACGQTVLPDRSILIGQKLVENAKIKKFKWNILDDFQTFVSKNNSRKIQKNCGMEFQTILHL